MENEEYPKISIAVVASRISKIFSFENQNLYKTCKKSYKSKKLSFCVDARFLRNYIEFTGQFSNKYYKFPMSDESIWNLYGTQISGRKKGKYQNFCKYTLANFGDPSCSHQSFWKTSEYQGY